MAIRGPRDMRRAMQSSRPVAAPPPVAPAGYSPAGGGMYGRRGARGATIGTFAAAAGGLSSDPRIGNDSLSTAQLNELRAGQDAAIRAYGQPPRPPVLSDDRDARASEATRMLQQATPFWEREENKALTTAAETGPRAGEAGYAQRADIQAWMDAQRAKGPAGQAMVDRFIEQQKARGLWDQPTPAVDQLIATPGQREAAAAGYAGTTPEPVQIEGNGSLKAGEMASNPAFTDPTFGIEALRGLPVDATASLMPGANQRGEAPAGYGGAAIRDVFNQPTPLPNMAFAGNGMEPDTQMTVAREQDVPGITGPVLSPSVAREMNLEGPNALVNKYKLLAMQR